MALKRLLLAMFLVCALGTAAALDRNHLRQRQRSRSLETDCATKCKAISCDNVAPSTKCTRRCEFKGNSKKMTFNCVKKCDVTGTGVDAYCAPSAGAATDDKLAKKTEEVEPDTGAAKPEEKPAAEPGAAAAAETEETSSAEGAGAASDDDRAAKVCAIACDMGGEASLNTLTKIVADAGFNAKQAAVKAQTQELDQAKEKLANAQAAYKAAEAAQESAHSAAKGAAAAQADKEGEATAKLAKLKRACDEYETMIAELKEDMDMAEKLSKRGIFQRGQEIWKKKDWHAAGNSQRNADAKLDIDKGVTNGKHTAMEDAKTDSADAATAAEEAKQAHVRANGKSMIADADASASATAKDEAATGVGSAEDKLAEATGEAAAAKRKLNLAKFKTGVHAAVQENRNAECKSLCMRIVGEISGSKYAPMLLNAVVLAMGSSN